MLFLYQLIQNFFLQRVGMEHDIDFQVPNLAHLEESHFIQTLCIIRFSADVLLRISVPSESGRHPVLFVSLECCLYLVLESGFLVSK